MFSYTSEKFLMIAFTWAEELQLPIVKMFGDLI